jgi:hypothetical protein
LVKGQGLKKILVEEKCELLGIDFIGINAEDAQSKISVERYNHDQPISAHLSSCEWYSSIVYFLQKLAAPP